MAWMHMMGADSVAYHEANVAERADDHRDATLDYYGSRGETPLVWGGTGRALLGVDGPVDAEAYRAVFGPGGACLPRTGARLVSTRRPGVELVVSPPKSVAELGVIGRADDMHTIADAERDATMAYLDRVVAEIGGRRGRAQTSTRTGGLVWAMSRHATTRTGDPQVHDHVLVANVVWMRDTRGGWKALDTALLRDQLHAATAVGRLAAARAAVELGYAIVADEGRSGRLGGWNIAGIPADALAVHSRRAAHIDDLVGPDASPRARSAAARFDRDAKTGEQVADLVARWQTELADAGFPLPDLIRQVHEAGLERVPIRDTLDQPTLDRLVDGALDGDGVLADRKVFARSDVIVALAPHLHGLPLDQLDRAVDAVLADERCVQLLGVAGARAEVFCPAAVLAREDEIALLAQDLATRPGPSVSDADAQVAIAKIEAGLGGPLTAGQHQAARTLLTSGAGLDLVVGVAGSGKTTCLAAVAAGFETAGYTVIGTATSGQAAKGLGEGAGVEARTVASLCWRLDHDQLALTARHVLILDEAGMTDDPDLARLLLAARTAGTKIIAVGDDRQLGAVGPGGGLRALLERHPERVSQLADNVRQRDPAERAALADLRAGDVDEAVGWYRTNNRIVTEPTRARVLDAMVEGWAADVADGREAVLLAWRRDNVGDLNRLARQHWADTGHLTGPEVIAPGGRRYAAGDLIVTLAPGPDGQWVTSERATITHTDPATGTLLAVTADGRDLHLSGEATGADRLAHGFAITAHRSQGATVDVAHVLEDGGGRELAYVAMSRARHTSRVYVQAPTPDMGVDRVAWSWGSERRQTWANDQGQPARVTLSRLEDERRQLARQVPPDVTRQLDTARARLAAAHTDLARLQTGTGRWANTPADEARRALAEAQTARARAAQRAAQHGLGPLARRHAQRDLHRAEQDLIAAKNRWSTDVAPHLEHLEGWRDHLTADVDRLETAARTRAEWVAGHPDFLDRIDVLDRDIAEVRQQQRELAREQRQHSRRRDQGLDLGM